MYIRTSGQDAVSLRIAGTYLLTLLLAAVFWAGPARANELRMGGTGSGTALLQLLATDFVSSHPDAHIETVSPALGSSGGIRALTAGKIDLAVLARPLAPGEQRGGLRVLPWARTPLVLATSDGELRQGLSVPLLIDILGKRRTTWDNGARIRLVLRIPDEIETVVLSALSPSLKKALDAYLSNPTAVTADTDLDAMNMLERTPGSLGVTTLSLMKVQGSQLKPLPLDGVPPSLETVASGRYPLVKELYLAHGENPPPLLTQFLKWLRSPAVAKKLLELELQPLFQ